MLKYLLIFSALLGLGAGAANAQDREAIFRKVSVPGASFDIVVATAKSDNSTGYYRGLPDPNVIYLGDGLVTTYTSELAGILDFDALLRPIRSTSAGYGAVLIYFVPKRTASDATLR